MGVRRDKMLWRNAQAQVSLSNPPGMLAQLRGDFAGQQWLQMIALRFDERLDAGAGSKDRAYLWVFIGFRIELLKRGPDMRAKQLLEAFLSAAFWPSSSSSNSAKMPW